MKLLPVIVTSVVLVSGLVSGAIAPSDGQHVASARRHTGIPSVTACGDRLWVTYYGGPTGGEDSNNYCVLTTSTDGGRTWKDVLVSDPDGNGPKRAFDPEVWVSPDKRLPEAKP